MKNHAPTHQELNFHVRERSHLANTYHVTRTATKSWKGINQIKTDHHDA